MKSYHKRGSNNITFIFTERKYSNKIKALNSYLKYTINSLVYKRKTKPKSVYIRYQWKYRNPDTAKISNYFWNQDVSLYLPPPPITRHNLLPFITNEMEGYLANFRAMGSDTIEPYKIFLEFNY